MRQNFGHKFIDSLSCLAWNPHPFCRYVILCTELLFCQELPILCLPNSLVFRRLCSPTVSSVLSYPSYFTLSWTLRNFTRILQTYANILRCFSFCYPLSVRCFSSLSKPSGFTYSVSSYLSFLDKLFVFEIMFFSFRLLAHPVLCFGSLFICLCLARFLAFIYFWHT